MNREINDLLRLAAGHVPRDRPADQRERVGRIGVGLGGAARVPSVPASTRLNAAIRASAALASARVGVNGVDLFDVLTPDA